MNDIAHTLDNIVQYTSGFGPTGTLPLASIHSCSLFSKYKPAKALRSSSTVGIGFVGIYAIFDILNQQCLGQRPRRWSNAAALIYRWWIQAGRRFPLLHGVRELPRLLFP